MQEQLFLFEPTFEEKVLMRLDKMEASIDRMRKAQFAKIGEAKNLALECMIEWESVKNVICGVKGN